MAKKEQKTVKMVDKTKKKAKKSVQRAIAYIKSSYNNTLITVTDLNGEVLATSSPGKVGFSGSRKSSGYAATKAAEDIVAKIGKYGTKELNVKVKGSGMGRQAAVKGLVTSGIKVKTLMDITSIPHGGCRPRKKPRA